ncbi:S-layer homology domain-containing protein [Paenibacillus sp. NPDC058071]|uniref:S-layer homology domain-containing protein n=1 Tax=Paenibacillus sp. NPDC058071 TaxID=3346326 RepID=UPI0036DF3932
MKKRSTIMAVIAIIMLLSSVLPASAAPRFKDVDSDKLGWAVPSINFMVDKGVMKGYKDGKFQPNWSITRAELAVMLYKLFPEKREKSNAKYFKDVTKNHWAYKEITAMRYHMGSFLWEGAKLKPEQPITRWELMLVLDSVFPLKKESQELIFFPYEMINIPPTGDGHLVEMLMGLKDIEKMYINAEQDWRNESEELKAFYKRMDRPDYLSMPFVLLEVDQGIEYISGNGDFEFLKAEALYNIISNDIMKPDDNGYFRPKSKVTRAEIATILHRSYNMKK